MMCRARYHSSRRTPSKRIRSYHERGDRVTHMKTDPRSIVRNGRPLPAIRSVRTQKRTQRRFALRNSNLRRIDFHV